jgi:hypothetical protein
MLTLHFHLLLLFFVTVTISVTLFPLVEPVAQVLDVLDVQLLTVILFLVRGTLLVTVFLMPCGLVVIWC